MKLPTLYLSVWKKDRFCVHIYFLFSVQFIAAVYPFMSNHQCLYPHIPMPGSYSKPVAVCFMTAVKLYLTSQYIFTVQADQQVCTALSKTPLSLFLSRSLSSCVRCIHPSLSLSVSLSFSIIVSLSLFPTLSVWLPKKHLMWALMCLLGYFPNLLLLSLLSL